MSTVQEQFDETYVEYAQGERESFARSSAEYFCKLNSSKAKISKQTIKSYFHPYVIAQADYAELKRKVKMMAAIVAKVGELLFREEEIQELFGFDPRLWQLMQAEPGYPTLVPIARYDAFYTPGNKELKFCEFNADGSSGMNETNTLEEIFLTTDTGKFFAEKFSLRFCELRKSLLDALLANYNEFSKKAARNPKLAIVDWKEVGTIHEFEALREVFIREGIPTVICDPRELEYRRGALWFRDLPIDLVYRRVVTTELLERWDEVQDFVKGYREGAFCLVGSFRTEVAHNKLIFCLLSDPRYAKFFSRGEQEFIARHIPWTRKLAADGALLAEIAHRKDLLLLKPYNAYGSRGVILGSECTESGWRELLNSLADQNYLVQEKIAIPQKTVITGAGPKLQSLKVNLSTFLYNQELAGFYTRVSGNEIISTARGGALVPTLVAGPIGY